MTDEIKAVIDKFRGGDEEGAFFELLEMPGDVIPALIACFRIETLAPVRAFLAKAAWERRDESVIPFLGEAINDLEEVVWQEALDGLVSFATTDSLHILELARAREFADAADHKRFHLWLEEAIQQVQFELRR
jgi:hypothetical protein